MISVIIPSYHSQWTIADCLWSVQNQNTKTTYEILVVNSSVDETPQIIKKRFPGIKLIQLKKKAIAATARNIGIEKSKGDILAFLDSDCSASPDWLNRMLYWHGKGYKSVGGSIVNGSPRNLYSRAEYPLEILEFSPHNPQKEVPFISAANSSFSKEVFHRYGSFPEIRAGEDLLFCQKLSQMGEKIIFDPELKVSHKNEINFSVFLKKQIIHGNYSFAARKTARLPGAFLNRPYFFFVFLPFLPFFRALRVIYRSLILRNKMIHEIIKTFPWFFFGCIMWSLGYAKGFLKDQKRKSKKKPNLNHE